MRGIARCHAIVVGEAGLCEKAGVISSPGLRELGTGWVRSMGLFRQLTWALLVAVTSVLPAFGAEPDLTARVLLVTGIDYPGHPWPETAPVLRRLLQDDSRLRVTVIEDPWFLDSPRLTNYDAVILHFMDWEVPGPGVAARENLRKFVAGGHGLVLTHFACGAWDGGEWPEFAHLAGRIWDPKLRGHDPHGRFAVEIADPDHPITRGLAAFETLDELYTCLAGDDPIRVLARAKSKVDGKDYPMAFVLPYGEGRVFHTVLGHDARAYASPGVQELVRRGCAWAAGLPPGPLSQP